MDILVSVDKWIQGLHKELEGVEGTEMRLELVTKSLHTQKKGLCKEIADRKELCVEFKTPKQLKQQTNKQTNKQQRP
jgi:hypothetical protein